MEIRGFKVHIAVLVLIVTFAALAGASYVYRQQHLERPLVRDLKATAQVQSADVTYVDGRANISVKLAHVADLSKVYHDVDRIVADAYGKGRYNLSLTGDSDADLDAFYAQAQYYVWEAIQRGNYAEMASAIDTEAAMRGLTEAKFVVAADAVFLQASDSSGHFVYAVVPRTAAVGGETP